MSDTDKQHINDVLELAALMRPAWPTISAGIRASGVPVCEGDPPQDPPQDPQDPGKSADPPEPDHKAEAEKWKALARKHEDQAKANRTAAQELEKIRESQKSAEQKAADKAAESEKRASTAAAEAARLRVALRKGLTETQAKRLVGDDEDALEADADELLASFKTNEEPPPADPKRRPQERLRAGAVPDAEPEDTDPGLPRLQRAYANADK